MNTELLLVLVNQTQVSSGNEDSYDNLVDSFGAYFEVCTEARTLDSYRRVVDVAAYNVYGYASEPLVN